MGSHISCQKCGQSFATGKQLAFVADVLKGRGFENPGFLELCPPCRREAFVHRMLGRELVWVRPPAYVPKRLSEKFDPDRKDPRTGGSVLKSSCWTCNNGCDALVYVKDGKVIKVEGDPSSPTTRGVLCAKGLASVSLLYHPERLRHPLRRTGERGEGKWERISWDEALETIARRLKQIEDRYGEDSVILATGTSRGWAQYFNRFASAYHKQMMGPGYAQCLWPRYTAQLLLGIAPALECPDILLDPGKTKCMLVWGTNPPNTSPIKASWMMDAKGLGARLIVVDPMFSEIASKADLWLQLRPGTDVALALGMLHIIIEERIYDNGFVDSWCNGFEELKERAADYPPSSVSEITQVPVDKIVEAARCYASTRPASMIQCLSTEQIPDTISACLSLGILAAITGNIDVPGGNIMPMHRNVVPDITLGQLLTQRDHDFRLGSREFPLLAGKDSWLATAHSPTVWKAMLTAKPYPVRAMYCQGSNPAVSYANNKMVMKALRSLDFISVADFFMTPTAELADVVLPVATWMERSSVQTFFQVTYDDVHLQQKAVEIGECRSDYRILNDLAAHLGFGNLMLGCEDEMSDAILEPLGITFQELKEMGRYVVPYTYRKYEKTGFGMVPFRRLHHSRKVELTPLKLRDLGFDPRPKHKEPLEGPIRSPELMKEYPLILTTGRKDAVYRHSELRNIGVLREIVPKCLLHLHPETAAAFDIEDGSAVTVESPRGSVDATAHLTLGIAPGVVLMPAQWPDPNNANILLHDEDTAPAIGSVQMRCQICRVRRKDGWNG
jgi:anaerobic selenocysteine-containing dehydrogenase